MHSRYRHACRVGISLPIHNRLEELEVTLESLSEHLTSMDRVCLVDNASEDQSGIDRLMKQFSSFHWIKNEENTGFGAAHHQALAWLQEEDCRYMLLLNPDLRLPSGALERLIEASGECADRWVLGPLLVRSIDEDPVIDSAGLELDSLYRARDRFQGRRLSETALENPDSKLPESVSALCGAVLFIPARIAVSGDKKRFLERSAKIQVGLLICVYALSYTPAILKLELTANHDETVWGTEKVETENPEAETDEPKSGAGKPFGLLVFFVLITQAGDVLQYGWGKLVGRRIIAPKINANRSWEGLIGGVCSASLLGSLLWWVTPFRPWEAALMSMIIAIMGFAGGMTMSAIKRDRGVQDYGTLVRGHLGVLDRIDSLCFAAPVFYHLTRHFFAATTS